MPQFSRNFLNKILNTGASELNRETQRREDVAIAAQQRALKLADTASERGFEDQQLQAELRSEEGIAADKVVGGRTNALIGAGYGYDPATGKLSAPKSVKPKFDFNEFRAGEIERTGFDPVGLHPQKEDAGGGGNIYYGRNGRQITEDQAAYMETEAYKLQNKYLDFSKGFFDTSLGEMMPPDANAAEKVRLQYQQIKAEFDVMGKFLPNIDAPPAQEGESRVGPSGMQEQYINGAWRELSPEAYSAISQQGGAEGLVQSAGVGVPQPPAQQPQQSPTGQITFSDPAQEREFIKQMDDGQVFKKNGQLFRKVAGSTIMPITQEILDAEKLLLFEQELKKANEPIDARPRPSSSTNPWY